MMADVALSVFKTVASPLKSVIVDRIKKHLDYIRNYNDNFQKVRENLEKLCCKKLDVDDAVMQGKQKGEKVKREATNWLKSVNKLTQMDELKMLMKDDSVAQTAVKMMEQLVLRTLLKEDKEILDKVVKMIKENNNNQDQDFAGANNNNNNRVSLNEEDYKRVGQVVVQVMAETTEEFKRLIKDDVKMAAVAMELMVDDDLEKLIKGDEEMAEIVRKVKAVGTNVKETTRQSDDDHHHDGEEELLLLQKHGEEVKPADKHTLKETVRSGLAHLGGLVMDPNFLKDLPEGAQLGLQVMDALCKREDLMSQDGYSKRHRCCGYCAVSLIKFCGQHNLSEAAEMICNQIELVLKKHPGEQVTRPKRPDELQDIQSGFLKGLQSREQLLDKVFKDLKDDNVTAVGVYGMGGSGKTTLAKEVKNGAKGMFDSIIMVEVSKAANIERIQDHMAAELSLDVRDIRSLPLRAKRLCDKLKHETSNDEKKKKTLVILDNIWEKLNLDDLGIPRECCKRLLTSRVKDVCKEMDVQDCNIHQVGTLNEKEARDLFQFHVGKRVDKGEYKFLADRLLKTCGGLPLSIVTAAYAPKSKDLPVWQKFTEELEKPISAQVSGVHHKTYSIIKSSYDIMENDEKKLFFLLDCLSPIGSSMLVESLMRYGIGLDLFQQVNKLSEARNQAKRWVEELVSSSLLLEGDSKEYVKIHDVV